MKFSINEVVFIPSHGQTKTIVDSELICGVEVYYMSDKTSYTDFQIRKQIEPPLNVYSNNFELLGVNCDTLVNNLVALINKHREQNKS